MTRQRPQKLIQVAQIAGAHGVRGDVRVRSFTAEPGACFGYGPLRDAQGAVLIEVKTVRTAKDHFIVTPKTLRQKEEWDAMKGTALFVPRDALPPPEGTDEFYHADLLGLPVYLDGVVFGEVRAIFDHGGGDLLDVKRLSGGPSVLIPFTREAVPVVDVGNARIELGEVSEWLDLDESGRPEGPE